MRIFRVALLLLLLVLSARPGVAQDLSTAVTQPGAPRERPSAAAALGSWRGSDPIWNGLAIGAIAGGLGFSMVMNSLDERGDTNGVYFFMGLGIGAGIGAGIDAMLDRGRSAFGPQGPTRRLRVAPIITGRSKGVTARVGF